MSKTEKRFTGYAVVSKDIFDDKVFKSGAFGIAYTDHDLKTCMRYCHGGSVVVPTYRGVLGKSLTIKWIRKYPRFEKSRRYSYPKYLQIVHLLFEWETIYTDEYERVAVYDPEK